MRSLAAAFGAFLDDTTLEAYLRPGKRVQRRVGGKGGKTHEKMCLFNDTLLSCRDCRVFVPWHEYTDPSTFFRRGACKCHHM